MKRYAITACTAVLAVAMFHGVARAQAPAVGAPESADQTIVEGAGVKVGEGTVLHPVVGFETGYTNNVFYGSGSPNDPAIEAPFLRLLVELNFASLSQQRMQSDEPDVAPEEQGGDLEWHAGLRLIGQEYISSNDAVDAQHNLAGGAAVHALVFPHRTWRFGFDDDYVRDNRPTNFESSQALDRDINNLMLQLRYEPEGRALSAAVRYTNMIDVFERNTDAFSNRIQHTFGARVNWQWLPITKLYADVSFGIFEPLGSASNRVPSTPLRGVVGIETAITTNTALNARLGWGDGFYSSGASPNQPIFGVQYAWRYSPFGQVIGTYSYDFTDSIQANYFRDHSFQIADNQQIDKFMMFSAVNLRFRDYQSVNIPGVMAAERNDLLFDFGLSPRYYIKDWFAATVDYDLLVDSTDFRYMTTGVTVDPSYVRHQIMAGVRAAW
jgi:hypothetical protein